MNFMIFMIVCVCLSIYVYFVSNATVFNYMRFFVYVCVFVLWGYVVNVSLT